MSQHRHEPSVTVRLEMNDLAAEMKFEEAEVIHRKLDKIRHGRQECKDTFFAVWSFDYIAVLAADSVPRVSSVDYYGLRKLSQNRIYKVVGVSAGDPPGEVAGPSGPPGPEAR